MVYLDNICVTHCFFFCCHKHISIGMSLWKHITRSKSYISYCIQW